MKVSVVVPLYNKAAYIRRTLDSVLAQTHADFELIVVDDGSTDNGPEIVRQIDDSRIRLISQENRGLSGARNRGAAESQTEWVAFLDADDEWQETFLEKVVAVIHAHPSVSVVFTNMCNQLTGEMHLPPARDVEIIADYLTYHAAHGWKGIIPSAVVIRKEALVKAGGFPQGAKYGEDIDTWARLAWTECEMACIPEPLAMCHSEASGRLCSQSGHYAHGFDALLATYAAWSEEGRIPPWLAESSLRFLHAAYLEQAYLLMDAGDNAGARRVLRTQCQARLCGYCRWWKYYLRTWTPAWFLQTLRWVRHLRTRTRNGGQPLKYQGQHSL
jgi:glycosyltransferase involved in cell wall biosynthesis